MKICVLSFYTNNYEIGKQIEPLHRAYCLKNNYDYKCFYEIPDYLKNRHPAWCKIHYLLEMLKQEYEYIFWIDADAFFCNFDMKIEDWIIPNKNLILCRDAGANFSQWDRYKHLINSGVMIFKNTEWSKTILDFILYFDNFKKFYNEPTWEQVGFRKCIKNNHLNCREHISIITKINFNSNTNNLDKFIKERGFILHLTTFNGKWPEKNLSHILKFKKKMDI
tara:strand:- start:17 stop:682 length:666 start_codon:yes stop_codon:yes gene_type:complete